MRLYELGPSHVSAARPLFADATFDRVFVDAFFEGRQPGRLFVDDPARPAGALLCRSYDYFLAGEPSTALRRFVRDAPAEAEVFAAFPDLAAARDAPTFGFYGFVPLTDAWRRTLLEDHRELEVIGRRAFRFDRVRAEHVRDQLGRAPDGIVVRPLDAELARRADEELEEPIAVAWTGYADFAIGGFGACALADGAILSVAYTTAVSDREANLAVATAEHARRRGLAAAVSAACIMLALDRGLTPTWDCDAENSASAHLALKLGFTEEPSFVELAFPGRRGPAQTAGAWTAEPDPAGRVWRRS